MRTLTPEQLERVERQVTEPCYIISIELDKNEVWPTNSAQGSPEPGRIRMGKISGEEARFSFWNENYQWTQNSITGVYLRRNVQVYWAYGPNDTPYYVNPGYWQPNYTTEPVNSEGLELIQLFDGFIYSMPRIDAWIEVVARATPPKLYPSRIIRQPFANFLPPAGYSVQFDGAILQIED